MMFVLQPDYVDFNDDETSFPSIDSVYLGMELLDTDLKNILLQQRLNHHYIKFFLYQILRGLKVILFSDKFYYSPTHKQALSFYFCNKFMIIRREYKQQIST